MKAPLTLVLLYCSFISLFAQESIQGIVIDKDTKKPIPDVIVQYGATSKEYDYTDQNGRFSIPQISEAIIYFQCIGYKPKSIPKSILMSNFTVEMELNPVYLNPVIISPGDADKLLDEAMLNTKKKLLIDQPIGYVLHFLQTKSTDTLQNEIYVKYATTLSEKDLKKNIKKERVPYILNIIDIKRIQKTVTPTSELYGAEYHASHLFTFGKSINNETKRSYSMDSSLIILQIAPIEGKGGWATGEITINKDDMTIASMEVESIDSALQIEPYKRYMGKQIKIMRKVGRFAFKKHNNKYYMTECYTFYRFRAIDEYGKEEDISYHCDVDFKGFVEKKQLRRRRLSGFCQELFYFPDSTTKEFWNESYELSENDGEKNNTSSIGIKSDKKTLASYLKQSAFFLPLLAVVYLIK